MRGYLITDLMTNQAPQATMPMCLSIIRHNIMDNLITVHMDGVHMHPTTKVMIPMATITEPNLILQLIHILLVITNQ